LGGDDIDHAVAERFFAERGGKPDGKQAKLTLVTARLAKECLSSQLWWKGTLDLGGEPSQHALDRAALEELSGPLIERTIAITHGVPDDANVAPAAVRGVVLVGGATRMPLVRAGVSELFGKPPLSDIDPDEVVGVGAALQAEALTAGSDTLLLDV